MNHITDFKAFTQEGFINCVVEIPKGTRVKYEVDPKRGDVVTPVRELHRRFKYPFNYGFIPGTLEEDGDPMDVCIIGCDRLEPLTHVTCRVLGCFKTVDNGEEDDKIVAVPYFTRYSKKQAKLVLEAYRFLKQYKYPFQKNTIVDGKFYSDEEAIAIIKKAVNRVSPSNNEAVNKITLS